MQQLHIARLHSAHGQQSLGLVLCVLQHQLVCQLHIYLWEVNHVLLPPRQRVSLGQCRVRVQPVMELEGLGARQVASSHQYPLASQEYRLVEHHQLQHRISLLHLLPLA